MGVLSRALKEPLLHFFVLGVLIFLAYGWFRGGAEDAGAIVVTRGQQTNLVETFARTWGRPPTPEEMGGLLDEYLREEIAYREASVRELDRNDTVIRRRLRQKLELLAEDLATFAPPTPAELEAAYAANAEEFRTETRYSLEQIVFSPDVRGNSAEADATALLEQLRATAPVDEALLLGDSQVLPRELTDAGQREIAATFGEEFAGSLAEVPLAQWEGPVQSAFGFHLVRLSARDGGRIPPLADVEDRVAAELFVERRRAALDLLYSSLAERYTIVIEPQPAR